ncbi:MAG: hypothetical protein HZB26_10820 [Candidatus Hydrogenedentes bacterium]|nr:hypothetical protein [Candidatus Hydrogenedentota bacterium]
MRLLVVIMLVLLAIPSALAAGKQTAASKKANAAADEAMYRPVEYPNKDKKGPVVVVIPGEIKSSNATFTQKVTVNNIADFGELELGNDNYTVLERSDLGSMMQELQLAANMGDKDGLKKFRKGKFATTKWLIRFDVLKAEPVAAAKQGFDGGAIGSIISGLGTGKTWRGSHAAGTAVGSIETGESAGIWIVGMRYKVIDAETSEQVASAYKEGKMEMGTKHGSMLGFSSSSEAGVTLDTLVQRLVQDCVLDLDGKK